MELSLHNTTQSLKEEGNDLAIGYNTGELTIPVWVGPTDSNKILWLDLNLDISQYILILTLPNKQKLFYDGFPMPFWTQCRRGEFVSLDIGNDFIQISTKSGTQMRFVLSPLYEIISHGNECDPTTSKVGFNIPSKFLGSVHKALGKTDPKNILWVEITQEQHIKTDGFLDMFNGANYKKTSKITSPNGSIFTYDRDPSILLQHCQKKSVNLERISEEFIQLSHPQETGNDVTHIQFKKKSLLGACNTTITQLDMILMKLG